MDTVLSRTVYVGYKYLYPGVLSSPSEFTCVQTVSLFLCVSLLNPCHLTVTETRYRHIFFNATKTKTQTKKPLFVITLGKPRLDHPDHPVINETSILKNLPDKYSVTSCVY
jgi:hypothetical protein